MEIPPLRVKQQSLSHPRHPKAATSHRTQTPAFTRPLHKGPSRLRSLPAAVKPLAKAKASWPAPIKPTLMLDAGPAHSPRSWHRIRRGSCGARWGRIQSKKKLGVQCQAWPLGRWPCAHSPPHPSIPAGPTFPSAVRQPRRGNCSSLPAHGAVSDLLPRVSDQGDREGRADLRKGSERGGGRRIGPGSSPRPSYPSPSSSRCADAQPLPAPPPPQDPSPARAHPVTPHRSPGSPEPRPPRGTRAPPAPPPQLQPIGSAAARRRPIEGRGRRRGAVASAACPAPPPPPTPRGPRAPGLRAPDCAWGLGRRVRPAGSSARGAWVDHASSGTPGWCPSGAAADRCYWIILFGDAQPCNSFACLLRDFFCPGFCFLFLFFVLWES